MATIEVPRLDVSTELLPEKEVIADIVDNCASYLTGCTRDSDTEITYRSDTYNGTRWTVGLMHESGLVFIRKDCSSRVKSTVYAINHTALTCWANQQINGVDQPKYKPGENELKEIRAIISNLDSTR